MIKREIGVAVAVTGAALAATGVIGLAIEKFLANKAPASCSFYGEQTVATRRSLKLRTLALKIEGLSQSGPSAHCLPVAESLIMNENPINPRTRSTYPGFPYLLPARLLP